MSPSYVGAKSVSGTTRCTLSGCRQKTYTPTRPRSATPVVNAAIIPLDKRNLPLSGIGEGRIRSALPYSSTNRAYATEPDKSANTRGTNM